VMPSGMNASLDTSMFEKGVGSGQSDPVGTAFARQIKSAARTGSTIDGIFGFTAAALFGSGASYWGCHGLVGARALKRGLAMRKGSAF